MTKAELEKQLARFATQVECLQKAAVQYEETIREMSRERDQTRKVVDLLYSITERGDPVVKYCS